MTILIVNLPLLMRMWIVLCTSINSIQWWPITWLIFQIYNAKQTRIIMEQPFFKKGSCIKWYFLLMILIAKSNSGSKFLLPVILSWMNHWHVLINIAADFCRGNWLTQSTCFRFCRKVRLIFIILVVRHIFIVLFNTVASSIWKDEDH